MGAPQRPHPGWRRVFTAGGIAAAVLCAACARLAPQNPTPPPARAVVVFSERGKPKSVQSRDKSDCLGIADAQAASTDAWTHVFTSCMTARGYTVF